MTYRGVIVEIPVGLGGLSGSKSQPSLGPDRLLIARNVSYDRGTLTKENGAAKYNATPITGAPSVLGGWDWWPDTATQRMVVLLGDGTLKKDSGGGTFAVTLASGLNVAAVNPCFVEGGKEAAAGNRKLFVFTGRNAVQTLAADGATTVALATPPVDWSGGNQPSFGFNHEGRLWGGGNLNDPHRVYYSTTASHEDFTGAGSGSLSVYPGESERLVGGMSYKGLAVLWKFPRGIYIVDTSDPAVGNWKVIRLSANVGSTAPVAFSTIDDDVIYVDATGNFQLLSSVTEFGDLQSRNLSRLALLNQFMTENVDFSALGRVQTVYYGQKREAHFLLASKGAAVNDRRMVVDFNVDIARFRFSDRDTNVSIWMRKDADLIARPLIGDSTGTVWRLDQSTKSKGGLAYTGEFQTPHLDLSHADPRIASKVKNGQFLELVAEPTGNWDLSVEVYWDGVLRQTIPFNMGSGGAALGSFVLDTDRLGGDALVNRRKRLVGSGRRISLKGRNANLNEDFSVARFYIHFEVADERTRNGA